MSNVNMEKLKEMLEHYAPLVLKEPPTVKIQGTGDDAELEFGHIVVYPGEEEQSTIVETIMVPCYDIGTMRVYYGGYWEPDDWDFESMATATNTYTALCTVIELHVALELDARTSADAEYEDWQETQRLMKEGAYEC